MDTQKHTVINHSFAGNVAGHITAPLAESAETHRQNVPFVGAVTETIIKGASTTTNLHKETTRIELPQHKLHLYLLSDRPTLNTQY